MPYDESKREITPQNLEAHNIYFDPETLRPPYKLPEYVDVVRETLLTFVNIVPEGGWQETLQREADKCDSNDVDFQALHPPASSLVPVTPHELDKNIKSPQWDAAYENLKSCGLVAVEAERLYRAAESGWDLFWRSKTFTVVDEKARELPGFQEGDCRWDEFVNFATRVPNAAPRTRPKPDLTYGFKIVTQPLDTLTGLARDEYTRCFSLESLGDLRRRKIISTPLPGLLRWTKSLNKKLLSTPDLICFPWAVAEFKRQIQGSQNESAVRCYCQAANASVAALELQAVMFLKVFGDEFPKVGPIVSFTCVGPIVKVWLTYFLEPDSRGVRARQMVCIWSTSVRLTWGVATLRAIIMNMHTWASRLLKPKLQSAILHALRQSNSTPETRKPAPVVDYDLSGIFTPPRPIISRTPRLPPSTPMPSDSPEITQVFSLSCKRTNTASNILLSPQTPVPPQQIAAAIPQGRPHSPLSLGTKDHGRTDTTPDSVDRTLIARKNIGFDVHAITGLLDSCHLQTPAVKNRRRDSNTSISSDKRPQEVSNILAPVLSPENESPVIISRVSQESGCKPKLRGCDNPNVSSIQSPMTIWEKLARNKVASIDQAPIPRQTPLIQAFGGTKLQSPNFLSSTFSFENFVPSPAFKSPSEPYTPTPKGATEAMFSDHVLLESVSDSDERSHDIQSTLSSEAEVFITCRSTAAFRDGQIEGAIPGPIVLVSPPRALAESFGDERGLPEQLNGEGILQASEADEACGRRTSKSYTSPLHVTSKDHNEIETPSAEPTERPAGASSGDGCLDEDTDPDRPSTRASDTSDPRASDSDGPQVECRDTETSVLSDEDEDCQSPRLVHKKSTPTQSIPL
ncbi:hypothetical protein EJ07DRAFT_156417 [Lizonia empirigonia]|nr:hypothetical protein EJ07DRAFT_156417 [Lizonia empirigonia]